MNEQQVMKAETPGNWRPTKSGIGLQLLSLDRREMFEKLGGSWVGVVKVQSNLRGTEDFLVSSEDESVAVEIKSAPKFLRKRMSGMAKRYFHAELTPDGFLTFGKLAAWQPW